MKELFDIIITLPILIKNTFKLFSELFILNFLFLLLFIWNEEGLESVHFSDQLANIIILNAIWVIIYYFFINETESVRYSTVSSFKNLLTNVFFILITKTSLDFYQIGPHSIAQNLIFGVLIINFNIAIRLFIRQSYRSSTLKDKRKILILSTSSQAVDLANSLTFSKKYSVIGFVNTDRKNKLRRLHGLNVYNKKDLIKLKSNKNIDLIVIPKTEQSEKNFTLLISELISEGFSFSQAPSMDNAFLYEVKLKSIDAEQLLARPSSMLLDKKAKEEIYSKTVLVTGAGGSIGSEICRQILRNNPKKIILLDASEYALYTINEELTLKPNKNENDTEIIPVLGSITSESQLRHIFRNNKVDYVYHAAAYKHVPLVESNIFSALRNNVFGTHTLCNIASEYGIKKFILISTDKAVRPTNIMGASKRLCELIAQSFNKQSDTIFSMVRFGNVLGSSGSVIPKFKAQIDMGGPLTVTHEDINRYFMSIPEAAHLVVSAGHLSRGGEVFLLDMGKAVNIVDLAKSMIQMHGLKPVLIKNNTDFIPSEDCIGIKFTGLRPGEKLFEELLIDSEAKKTLNPKILKAVEVDIDTERLNNILYELDQKMKGENEASIKEYFKKLPLNYTTANEKL
jgi:FlaA1/EpsC-like NDP-sugar epimerase